MRLAWTDEGNFPEATDTRQAYDLLADGFGDGFNGPFVITASAGLRRLAWPTVQADVEGLQTRAGRHPGRRRRDARPSPTIRPHPARTS